MGSEFSEDLWIIQNVKLPDNGFYVDLGCAWPEQYSNTAFLRKRGWRGLCVDGNPIYAPKWKDVEEFTCAIIGDGNPALFEANGVPELSRVGSGQIVPTIRLCDLLSNQTRVDVLSCDLEGHEFEALRTFDWQKFRPQVVISEYNTYGIGEDFRVRDMLLELGYAVRHQTKANLIYTA
jgi:hypothetical protein